MAEFDVPAMHHFARQGHRRAMKNVWVDSTFVPSQRVFSGGTHGVGWGMMDVERAWWESRNDLVDLGKLIRGFFRCFAGEDGRAFNWARDGVSVLKGGFFTRASQAMWGEDAMVVQDPFLGASPTTSFSFPPLLPPLPFPLAED